MAESRLPDRIQRFVEGDRSETFDELARAAFAFQYERIEPFRRLCERRGVTPDGASGWRDLPLVPASAFRTVELAAAPAREVFRSSGTTGERRGVHHHPYPELYEAVIDATFPDALLTRLGRAPVLSLIPSREQVPDSSLGFLADRVLRRHAAPGSACAFGGGGVSFGRARSWLSARQRDGRPGVVLATAFALDQLLGSLLRTG
ncbi:MAG: hypothetical protein R3325_14970, partial [Thermoanaerobaculia bacterium]|nr:hypothetical protein [Thermoanaerobaculia bacterium]